MIRAIVKEDHKYAYIYQIYYQKNAKEEYMWHFLVSLPNSLGLRVFYLEELSFIEIIENFKPFKVDKLFEYQHPILKEIFDTDWETYEGIIEGNYDAWRFFEKRLGHRP